MDIIWMDGSKEGRIDRWTDRQTDLRSLKFCPSIPLL